MKKPSEKCGVKKIVLKAVFDTIDIIKNDPDDNIILACALKARADYIVSGDKHLIQIVTPMIFHGTLRY